MTLLQTAVAAPNKGVSPRAQLVDPQPREAIKDPFSLGDSGEPDPADPLVVESSHSPCRTRAAAALVPCPATTAQSPGRCGCGPAPGVVVNVIDGGRPYMPMT